MQSLSKMRQLPSVSGAHVIQLDALRALAIGLVWFEHWMHPVADQIGIHGSYGVWLFFTLSGYLITGILMRYHTQIMNDEMSLKSAFKMFFARRFLRIFPGFYLFLFIAWLSGQMKSESVTWHFLYLSNFYFLTQVEFSSPGHLWSLAVEEQFYLFWPFMVLALGTVRLVNPIVAGIGIALLFRVICVWQGWPLAEYVVPLAALDTLGMGALVAWLQRNNRPIPVAMRFAQVLAILSFPFVGIASEWVFKIFAPLVIGLCSSLLIELCMRRMRGLPGYLLELPFILYLGRISYGLYLYHDISAWLIPQDVFSDYVSGYYRYVAISAMVRGLLTVAIASPSWFLWERWFNRLKRHFTVRATEHEAPSGRA